MTTEEKRTKIRELSDAGVSQLEIAQRFNVGRKFVRHALGYRDLSRRADDGQYDQRDRTPGCARCGLRSVPVASNPTGEHECLPARAEAFLGRKGEPEWP